MTVPPSLRSYVSLLILAILIVSVNGQSAISNTTSALLKTGCATLTPSSVTIVSGTSGTILFSCGNGPALIVRQPDKYIPTFTLPRGYTVLTIVGHVSGQSMCSRGSALVSGARFQFNKTGIFDYCALFSAQAAESLASFSLKWSNPGLGTQSS